MLASLPHPADSEFPDEYGRVWTHDPELLPNFFTADGTYTDVAMRGTYTGREGIQRFHRWMLKFSPDSLIVFGEPAVQDGRAYYEWTWSGSINGPLRLPGGGSIDAAGRQFSATGIAACRYDESGLLTSHRDFWDVGLLAEQLGHNLVTAEFN
ncbi:nuclear transport factor 2 family protein [Mycolicibacterium sp. P9-22]|uniref:nuclear transport factor 2 family protein n=1 Tax=Mycolicibacterium sp. P9-22 TaxID=2024613 RepID=UPI0011EFFCC3|nr:nuclear transport factor 2 family protein [Mycolicibacterium sp. P9-22]KAA0120512.1 nuclear transport factor 2 family protein [Mycolicibacterium sp. P9-22]